jgi:hypothetical protein
MAKTDCRPKASAEKTLHTCIKRYPHCRKTMWSACVRARVVITLEGRKRLRLHIRRCQHRACPRDHQPYRPEAEEACGSSRVWEPAANAFTAANWLRGKSTSGIGYAEALKNDAEHEHFDADFAVIPPRNRSDPFGLNG